MVSVYCDLLRSQIALNCISVRACSCKGQWIGHATGPLFRPRAIACNPLGTNSKDLYSVTLDTEIGRNFLSALLSGIGQRPETDLDFWPSRASNQGPIGPGIAAHPAQCLHRPPTVRELINGCCRYNPQSVFPRRLLPCLVSTALVP